MLRSSTPKERLSLISLVSSPFVLSRSSAPADGALSTTERKLATTSLLRGLFEHSSTMQMLRMLTHLTIDIDLMTPRGREESWEYGIMACHTMKRFCLTLSGASNLKELTINGRPGDRGSKPVDLVDILWPLLFLREAVEVTFKSISAGAREVSPDEKGPEVSAAFGQRIAHIKLLCNNELGKPGWEERCWEFHGLREAEEEVFGLDNPGKQLLLSFATPGKHLLSLAMILLTGRLFGRAYGARLIVCRWQKSSSSVLGKAL